MIKLPPVQTRRSAKDFLLCILPSAMDLFDVPKNILGFDTLKIARQHVYAMSEETAKAKIEQLKKLVSQW